MWSILVISFKEEIWISRYPLKKLYNVDHKALVIVCEQANDIKRKMIRTNNSHALS